MEVITERIVAKARKHHDCDLCGFRIPAGSQYIRTTTVDNNQIYDSKIHRDCKKIAHALDMFDECDEGLGPGEFQEAVSQKYYTLLTVPFSRSEETKDIFTEVTKVDWSIKLAYVIRKYVYDK